MKVSAIVTLDGILSGIKINRIKEREDKDALLRNYLAIHRIAKAVEGEKKEIVDKFQKDWAEELAPVQALREKGEPVTGHDDYLDAEQDALRTIATLYEKEEEIAIVPVPSGTLCNPDIWAEDITLGQIPGTIDFLVEHGVAE